MAGAAPSGGPEVSVFKRFFKRFDFLFAAAAVVGVVVPLAWHAHIEREDRRMLERVGAEANAKFWARRALERDLVLLGPRDIKSGGKLTSAEYHRAVLAVFARHGVKPPPELEGLILRDGWGVDGLIGAGWSVEGGEWRVEAPDPDSPASRRYREEMVRERLKQDLRAVEDLYWRAEMRAADEAKRRGENQAAAIHREYDRFAAERRRALLDVYARYGAAPPPDLVGEDAP